MGQSVEVAEHRITVTEMDGPRIARLRIAPAGGNPEPPDGPPPHAAGQPAAPASPAPASPAPPSPAPASPAPPSPAPASPAPPIPAPASPAPPSPAPATPAAARPSRAGHVRAAARARPLRRPSSVPPPEPAPPATSVPPPDPAPPPDVPPRRRSGRRRTARRRTARPRTARAPWISRRTDPAQTSQLSGTGSTAAQPVSGERCPKLGRCTRLTVSTPFSWWTSVRSTRSSSRAASASATCTRRSSRTRCLSRKCFPASRRPSSCPAPGVRVRRRRPARAARPPDLFSAGVPVLGICYGFQLMVEGLGGTVRRTGAAEYGATTLEVTAPGPDAPAACWPGCRYASGCGCRTVTPVWRRPPGSRSPPRPGRHRWP